MWETQFTPPKDETSVQLRAASAKLRNASYKIAFAGDHHALVLFQHPALTRQPKATCPGTYGGWSNQHCVWTA
ncbi:hypothetical protein VP1G_10496 [Cytospora mali]|uniref:Uncharacterized protein n=1 Tax=Cytospora mali TaxID=578113 RepID=A0A194UME1_CYTMA|nr:hypothetical protein VP1G_10496 [Valsa mali var. pyri (nom. inval.)]